MLTDDPQFKIMIIVLMDGKTQKALGALASHVHHGNCTGSVWDFAKQHA